MAMLDEAGITPAGAGKTHGREPFFELAEDHPRRCGENLIIRLYTCTPVGSPPQVRGKRGDDPEDNAACRITPAGAGKTNAACILYNAA